MIYDDRFNAFESYLCAKNCKRTYLSTHNDRVLVGYADDAYTFSKNSKQQRNNRMSERLITHTKQKETAAKNKTKWMNG